ncbi:hypothetical protein E6P09_17160 (plasmid) [Haloferax mediterranei ATCC 33500]|uniref:Uncharacterized protein n=1 Tax=Haloferax mediterranei (strain ATCC 33500 / DSM 1411 / JCM 8866 / NBRC 14739 / NCIMB 2177 / R-4) TaxID=523841 RepID=M0INI6_HALMT|nr:hypothetical protein [Haloferax mediterranei]AHZ24641.1 hypothetical protein BM92_17250 [Haloferax mediterranei ATCC 33500]ELZ97408.1 hypothetical protein C439_18838 [Haloferax mediterranei ATCC 33500]MDX5990296.1 hypothetical protein [Haloferax mediterranei ATCC 33500]QCQ77036.1 hypothetical protein E6P09_17160 [Haloferax mediterranei ATCC 33500]
MAVSCDLFLEPRAATVRPDQHMRTKTKLVTALVALFVLVSTYRSVGRGSSLPDEYETTADSTSA